MSGIYFHTNIADVSDLGKRRITSFRHRQILKGKGPCFPVPVKPRKEKEDGHIDLIF